MTIRKTQLDNDAQYSPDLKLRVVLEYLRNPRRRKNICKQNQISEELLTQWHQEFMERADEIFSSARTNLGNANPIEPPNDTAIKPTADETNSETIASWGIRLNDGLHSALHSPSSSRTPPSWLNGYYLEEWTDKNGVIIWDNTTEKMEVLWARQALDLLAKLHQSNDWRTEGIPIIRRFTREKSPEVPEPEKPHKKKGKSKGVTPVPIPNAKPVMEEVEEEQFRLPVTAGVEVFTFLEEHESLLKEIAEKDEKHKDEVLDKVWTMLFRMAREDEVRAMDFSKRPLPWTRDAASRGLVCNLAPNRGTIIVGANELYWRSYIEQPEEFKRYSPLFVKLEEAVAWTEQELLALQQAAKEKAQSPQTNALPKPKMDLTPYLIERAVLEPERITYRVFIELQHEPENFKTMEMSFGKKFRYDEEFPSPRRLSRELQIDSSQAVVEWPGNIESRTYLIHSTATYFQETVAAAQAQRLWDQGGIQRLHQTGKIKQARYGCEEVETGYCTWLGGLQDPEQPWDKEKTRAEYMANWAMSETILHALDLDRFKEAHPILSRWLSDEELLETLHERRAGSKYIPASARTESEQWLRVHSKETRPDRSEV